MTFRGCEKKSLNASLVSHWSKLYFSFDAQPKIQTLTWLYEVHVLILHQLVDITETRLPSSLKFAFAHRKKKCDCNPTIYKALIESCINLLSPATLWACLNCVTLDFYGPWVERLRVVTSILHKGSEKSLALFSYSDFCYPYLSPVHWLMLTYKIRN